MGDYLQNVKLLVFTNALIIANDELIEKRNQQNRMEMGCSLSSNGNSRNKF